MTNSQRLAVVRECLLRWLENKGEAATEMSATNDPVPAENEITRESILVRNDFFCGRRFHTPTHNAVWFIEEDQLKIYRNDGELTAVFTGDQIDRMGEQESAPEIIAFPAATDDTSPVRKAA